MLKTIGTAWAYLTYYKKQTLTLLLGMILSVALFTGVSSLVYSGRTADTERCRSLYGDAHYSFPLTEALSGWREHRREQGFTVEKAGTLLIKEKVQSPYNITFAYGDREYLDMFGRKLLSGNYPKQPGEAALDEKTLRNLELSGTLGETFRLAGRTFTLRGIVADKWDAQASDMEVFVSRDQRMGKETQLLYVKFREDRPVYPQLTAFFQYFHAGMKDVDWNSPLLAYVGGYPRESVLSIVQEGLKLPSGKTAYIWGTMNETYRLTEKLVGVILGLFAAFVLFSLFQVSVRKRMSQYGVMQVLGMDAKGTFGLLAWELFLIFLAGYPLGALLGNGAAGLFYSRMGEMFVNQDIGLVRGGLHGTDALQVASEIRVEAGSFHVSQGAAVWGAALFLAFLLLISAALVRRMKKHTWAEIIAQNAGSKRRSRRIYSLKRENMTRILTRKFILERKGMFLAVILSLSLGGVLFLGTTYVVENTRIHNQLAFKADDGLASDIQAWEDSHDLSDVIPKKAAEHLRTGEGIEEVNPVSYTLGELPLENGIFTEWKDFYEDGRPDPVIAERYNGRLTRQSEEDYRLKVNVYGYSKQMLEGLSEYLLEGSISPEALKEENSVILQPLMDGQGYYCQAVKAGDTIRLKVPRSQDVPEEALRFEGPQKWYTEREFKVAALVSRPLGKTKDYINLGQYQAGGTTAAVIMTNGQMEKNFGIQGYNSLGITLKEGADSDAACRAVRAETSGVPKCLVTDYTRLMRQQDRYLQQKLFFFYGIAAILLIISLFHMANSMQYLVAARKHEWGILRAMGITDAGLRRMLAREGLFYGICAAGLMTVLYMAVQKILYFAFQHVFLYLHSAPSLPILPAAAMILADLLLCTGAMLWAGRDVLRDGIIEEIAK